MKHKRNHTIFRIRGCSHLFKVLPAEIVAVIGKDTATSLRDNMLAVESALDTIKVKRFVCASCADTSKLHLSRNKKAYACDYCNTWADKLYNVKKDTNV